MSRQVNLEMSHYTYQELCDAVERAAEHSKSLMTYVIWFILLISLKKSMKETIENRIWIIKHGNCMKNCLETRKYIIINIFIMFQGYLRIMKIGNY